MPLNFNRGRGAGNLLPAIILVIVGCDGGYKEQTAQPVGLLLVDITESSGLQFEHHNGMTGQLHRAEVMSGGVALLDYDGDGDLDVYLVQGGDLPEPGNSTAAGTADVPAVSDQLFRNDSGSRIRFTDSTAAAGIQPGDYGMGAAVGDVNADGFPDLYVTALGENRMLLNSGDGTFADISMVAGTATNHWSIGARFGDIDRDGMLDLYVGNYASLEGVVVSDCRALTTLPDYCEAHHYPPTADQVFLNRGINDDGIPEFTDASSRMGIDTIAGASSAVVVADFNNDRWPDIFVATDGMANRMWMNSGGKRFTEAAALSGVAGDSYGNGLPALSASAIDIDLDGDYDLFVSHGAGTANTLHINDGTATFTESQGMLPVAARTLALTSFGASFLDANMDGLTDVYITSGATHRLQAQIDAGDPFPLRERNQLLLASVGGFTETETAGAVDEAGNLVSRAVAGGDLDNDGDIDLVVLNNNAAAQVFENRSDPDNWIGVVPLGLAGELLAADIIYSVDGQETRQKVQRTSGYGASGDGRGLLQLSDPPLQTVAVRVNWTDGSADVFADLETGKYHRLVKGQGDD